MILSYFMKFTGQEAALCSMDGKKIKCIEGYSVDVDLSIEDRIFILKWVRTANNAECSNYWYNMGRDMYCF